MFKQLAIILVCTFVLTQAVPLPVSEETAVRNSMRSAFKQGLAKFEGGHKAEELEKVVPEVNKLKPHVYSQYTKDLAAIGGGKPAITDQYRQNKYVPMAPSVVAPEHKVVSDKPTPEEAAQIFVPHPPLQYTTDRLY